MCEQYHLEGPNPQTFFDVETCPNLRAKLGVECEDFDHTDKTREYDCLSRQVAEGLYDGDGPADVAEVSKHE